MVVFIIIIIIILLYSGFISKSILVANPLVGLAFTSALYGWCLLVFWVVRPLFSVYCILGIFPHSMHEKSGLAKR